MKMSGLMAFVIAARIVGNYFMHTVALLGLNK
jgi:hypothetical protein